jgi:hypothetical protein
MLRVRKPEVTHTTHPQKLQESGTPSPSEDAGLSPEERALNLLTEHSLARLGDTAVSNILADLPRLGRELFVARHGEEYARKLESLMERGD